ncbi:MAG: RsmE family RNA methyltransferase [Cyclobacteriaceae bacterium]
MHVFYAPNIGSNELTLSAEESSHCIRTLRHKEGDRIHLVNGKGEKYEATIEEPHPKKCMVSQVQLLEKQELAKPIIHLAIAPTKNLDRIEWMIEKLCELGIPKVSFIQCHHSERKVLKLDRLARKTISALKQSGNLHQMQLSDLMPFHAFMGSLPENVSRHIAIVSEGLPYLLKCIDATVNEIVILIGPEGDFSDKEVKAAGEAGFQSVSLGKGTLRTETAGLVACHTAQVVLI